MSEEKDAASLDLEDFDLQVKAARASLAAGRYAAARGELQGAIVAVDAAEKRTRMVTMTIDLGPLMAAVSAALEAPDA
jgi:hypothetical protein